MDIEKTITDREKEILELMFSQFDHFLEDFERIDYGRCYLVGFTRNDLFELGEKLGIDY